MIILPLATMIPRIRPKTRPIVRQLQTIGIYTPTGEDQDRGQSRRKAVAGAIPDGDFLLAADGRPSAVGNGDVVDVGSVVGVGFVLLILVDVHATPAWSVGGLAGDEEGRQGEGVGGGEEEKGKEGDGLGEHVVDWFVFPLRDGIVYR